MSGYDTLAVIIVAILSGAGFGLFMRQYKMGPFLEKNNDTDPVPTPEVPAPVPEPVVVPAPVVPQKTKLEVIYECAHSLLGQHLSLNDSVPPEVGCVQAVSYVLLKAGYKVPQKGIDGVNALIDWMLRNGFQEVTKPQVGAVITAHRPNRGDVLFAHVGIYGKDWIMSNSSESGPGYTKGHWDANYTHHNWYAYFLQNGSVSRHFIPL